MKNLWNNYESLKYIKYYKKYKVAKDLALRIYTTHNLSGKVFADLDSNTVFGPNEYGFLNHIVEVKTNQEVNYLTTNSNGDFYFTGDTGQYTITYITDTLWKETSNITSYNIQVSPDTVISNLNFGIMPEFTKADLAVYLTNSATVCSNTSTLWLNVKNLGTETVTGADLELWGDPATTIQSARGNGVINANYVTWSLPDDFYPFVYTN